MAYVLLMSTDQDIIGTPIAAEWGHLSRYQWGTIYAGGIGLPDHCTIIVIAHGNDVSIGNEGDSITIQAHSFIDLIQRNMMSPEAKPDHIYISACSPNGHAQFAANVIIAAEDTIWPNTVIYGHRDYVDGAVPGPSSGMWTPIYPKNLRLRS